MGRWLGVPAGAGRRAQGATSDVGIAAMVLSLLAMAGAASNNLRPGVLCQSPALPPDCMFSIPEAKNCAPPWGSFDLGFRDERGAGFVDTMEAGNDSSETWEETGHPGSSVAAR